MTAYAFPTRRVLLRDLGKAGLAILVLGSAACASDDTAPSTEGGSDSTAPNEATTTAPVSSSSTTAPATVSGHQWARANLGFVSAYVLYRQGEAAVVDTGVAGSEAVIEEALATAGLGWESVGHVIITHKHNDHQGSLQGVLDSASGADWYAGTGDMNAIVANSSGTPVGDGDVVFGLEIIGTPGHTPGHVSVLDPLGRILVVGDSARGGPDGGLTGPNAQFSEDLTLAHESVRKMAGFDYEVVLVGHGEPVLAGGAAAMMALAATFG